MACSRLYLSPMTCIKFNEKFVDVRSTLFNEAGTIFNFSMKSCSYSLSTMASSNNPPKYHSAVAFQKFKGEDGAERARALTTMYVVQLAALPRCIDPRRRSTSCDCLHQQLRSTIWMPHIVSGILDHHLKPHMLKPKRTPSHS